MEYPVGINWGDRGQEWVLIGGGWVEGDGNMEREGRDILKPRRERERGREGES